MRTCLSLLVVLPCLLLAQGVRAVTPVTVWTEEADALGDGNANWHSLAIMHQAMHDALNAANPVYARWLPAAPNEPPAVGAAPLAAMQAAAAAVLVALHPAAATDIQALLAHELAEAPPSPARDAGQALGAAIGAAAVAARRDDGFQRVELFPASKVDGQWRPTPPTLRSSGFTHTRPFLFADRGGAGGSAPPQPGSPRYLADVAETGRLGALTGSERTAEQSEAATFWAYQSTQRGFVHLAAELIGAEPRFADLPVQARLMAQFTAAMADSAILIWDAKAHWNYWRPVTAINTGAFGVPQNAAWHSFIETPPHPEYPSGHASDCFTGAGFLQAILGAEHPLTYVAQSAAPDPARPAEVWTSDMGKPPPPVELMPVARHFSSLPATAQECADSRIWAGAHFRSANEESQRIAREIVSRALMTVPPLPPG